jgi:hypothetical protein
MRWAEHVTRIGAKRNANGVLVEKPQRNRPLGRTRRRWEDNIEVNLKEKHGREWTGFRWLRTGTCCELL